MVLLKTNGMTSMCIIFLAGARTIHIHVRAHTHTNKQRTFSVYSISFAKGPTNVIPYSYSNVHLIETFSEKQ